MSYPIVQLKKGKEANVGFGHPWIFSGALERSEPQPLHGALVHIADREGRIIATGGYSRNSMIAVRVFALGSFSVDRAWITNQIREADTLRSTLGFSAQNTTGYRVVFGEADHLPGLVIDRYNDVFVIQISTACMDSLRDDVVAALQEIFEPRAIVERSDVTARAEEGLQHHVGPLVGQIGDSESVEFMEHGFHFAAQVLDGQKTGFFLDQKDLRARVRDYCTLAHPARVLNLFSYTGATGVYALAGGAQHVYHVDSSAEALLWCPKHVEMNTSLLGPAAEKVSTEQGDVFSWLSAHDRSDQFDMVLLDPPALIKSGKDLEPGQKAYHFLNRAAMRLVRDGGIFITSSCSHYLPEEDFQFLLRRASIQAGIELQLLEVVRQSSDHPQSLYFPESLYLKSFVFRCKNR